MKRIFTLLAAAFVTITSFAAPNDGRITFNDNSRKQLWFEVDGKRYTNNDNQLVISNLRPGTHNVVVYAQQRYSDWRNIFDRNGRKQIVYQSTIQVKQRQNTIISIDRSGRVQVVQEKIKNRDRDNWYDDDRFPNDNRLPNDRFPNNQYPNDRYPDDDRFDPSRSAMDVQSFEMLKRALSRESFEKSRLEIAKSSIDRNNFSTLQVRDLLLLFSFENSKLDLAKYAYGKVVDKNNFFQVYDVFSFSSSKEDLANYIRRTK